MEAPKTEPVVETAEERKLRLSRARKLRWNRNHAEQVKGYVQRWRDANREHYNAQASAYRLERKIEKANSLAMDTPHTVAV